MATANNLVKLTDGAPIIPEYNKNVDILKEVLAGGVGGGGGGSGAQVYVQDDEPADVPVGTLWYDTDEPDAGGGGSGGGVGYGNLADVPPANPTAWDDEFDGDVLDPKWTLQLPGLGIPASTLANGQILLPEKLILPICQVVPAGAWEFTCKFIMPAYVEQFANFGFLMSNDTDNYVKTFNINWGEADAISFQLGKDGGYQGNAVQARRMLPSPTYYMRVVKRFDVNNVAQIDYKVSTDGLWFNPFFTQAETALLPNGVTKLGIYGSNQEPTRVIFRAEWFRKTA
jgi:hypothetical protein